MSLHRSERWHDALEHRGMTLWKARAVNTAKLVVTCVLIGIALGMALEVLLEHTGVGAAIGRFLHEGGF